MRTLESVLAQQRGAQCDLQNERDQVREQLQAQRTMAAEAEAKVRGAGGCNVGCRHRAVQRYRHRCQEKGTGDAQAGGQA